MSGKKSDTFVPTVSLPTSLHFPQTNVPINTRRTNCWSLTKSVAEDKLCKRWRIDGEGGGGRDKFINFKYDYDP